METAPAGQRFWRARAKVNLTLHIMGRRLDGWHELDSVVAFAGCCDWLSFEPGGPLSLSVDGPTAESAGRIADRMPSVADQTRPFEQIRDRPVTGWQYFQV